MLNCSYSQFERNPSAHSQIGYRSSKCCVIIQLSAQRTGLSFIFGLWQPDYLDSKDSDDGMVFVSFT